MLKLGHKQLTTMLESLAPVQADDADLYIQHHQSESISLEEGMVKQVSASSHQGVGARVICGEAAGLACTDRLETTALLETINAAKAIAKHGDRRIDSMPVKLRNSVLPQKLYTPTNPMQSVSLSKRRELLEEIDSLARSLDPRVKQVFASIGCGFDDVRIIRLDGQNIHDLRPLVRLNVSIVVEQNGRRETGVAGGGGRFDLNRLFESGKAQDFTREAVRLALLNLDAIAAPAGVMPVVLGCGWPGVLLHEAVGHGLEGDFNRKGVSTFANKMGQRVASPGVTVVDDGSIADRRGSLNVDDEGTTTGRTILIEDGILCGYMQDRQNARLMNVAPTGNGRRQSYAHPILPRMTNTFMLAGKDDPQEMLSSLDNGLYAVNFGGGQVDITSGKFVFTTSEAYLVENGKIKAPVKNATLIGSGPEAMQRISMIGNDLQLDPGVGMCGKDGQNIPVGVGMPSIKLDELIVGGAETG
ncbi:MAG: metalloprotease TldD [Mariprofundales bacterium]